MRSVSRLASSPRVALLALACFGVAPAARAATGDPIAPLVNVAQGGVNDHDPYFQDFNRSYGSVALSNGNVVVGWRARDNTAATPPSPDGDLYGAFFKVIGTNGAAVSGTVAPYLDINAAGTGYQNTPVLAALTGGGFVISWNSVGGPGDTYFPGGSSGGDAWARVYDNSGNAVSGTFHVNENDPTGTADEQSPVGVVGLSDGGFAIVWFDDNDATGNTDDYFVRAFNANGTARGASVQIGGVGAEPFFEDFDSAQGIAALSDGGYAVGLRVRDSANDGTGTSFDGTAPNGGYAAMIRVFNANGTARTGVIFPYGDINPDFSGSQNTPSS